VAAARTSKSLSLARSIERMEAAAHVASVTLNIEPVSASRPRVTRWGTYHAKPYKAWLDAVGELLEGRWADIDPDADLIVTVESIMTKARTSKLKRPRPDVDNLAKGPLDVITKCGGYWRDDSQVVGLFTSKRFAAPGEAARTEVHIYKL